jgi:hypothetical protein
MLERAGLPLARLSATRGERKFEARFARGGARKTQVIA